MEPIFRRQYPESIDGNEPQVVFNQLSAQPKMSATSFGYFQPSILGASTRLNLSHARSAQAGRQEANHKAHCIKVLNGCKKGIPALAAELYMLTTPGRISDKNGIKKFFKLQSK